MNIVLVSHCSLIGNSAMHVFSIAKALRRLGHSCVMLIPDGLATLDEYETPTFPVLTFDQAAGRAELFSGGESPDLIHAWSPREHVRAFVADLSASWNCPYIVHMEDNEQRIVADDVGPLSYAELARLPERLAADLIGSPWRAWPRSSQAFIAGAAGYTCLVDRLLEFAPTATPNCVFWPGFDEAFWEIESFRGATRKRLNILPDETAIFYSGNLHPLVREDIRSLYLAVALLRRRGQSVRLIRTGWDHCDLGLDAETLEAVGAMELGFVPREEVPQLLAAADVLVHPGMPDDFNDYRFPSKVPEYLVSGRPVLLSDSNVGAHLRDGVDVLKLRAKGAFEIANGIGALIKRPGLAKEIGCNGRRFAEQNLTWAGVAKRLDGFYSEVVSHTSGRRSISGASCQVEFPVRIVALGGAVTDLETQGNLGLKVVCLDLDLSRGDGDLEGLKAAAAMGKPFCVRWTPMVEAGPEDDIAIDALCEAILHGCFHREREAALVVLDGVGAATRGLVLQGLLRARALSHGVGRLHLTLMDATALEATELGMDTATAARQLATSAKEQTVIETMLDAVADWEGVAKSGRLSLVRTGLEPQRANDQPRPVSLKAYAFWLRVAVLRALSAHDRKPRLIFVEGWVSEADDPKSARTCSRVTQLSVEAGLMDFIRGPSEARDRKFVISASQLIPAAQLA